MASLTISHKKESVVHACGTRVWYTRVVHACGARVNLVLPQEKNATLYFILAPPGLALSKYSWFCLKE